MSSYLFSILSLAAFAGAVVSGATGFAFSAAAGAILLHVMKPIEAVPLMMVCSLGVQGACLISLRKRMDWNKSLPLIAGGIVGIPPAVYLLEKIDIWTFRVGFGVFVATYAAYMLLRPAVRALARNNLKDTLVGFGGGLVGGLTAMPGALPTIWCDLQGMTKHQQRGLVQPFIFVMQIAAVSGLMLRDGLASNVLWDFAACLPALAAGTAFGIFTFGRINDLAFRRVVLAVLFVSGIGLVI